MPRGTKKEIIYTGKALKLDEQYKKLLSEAASVKKERDEAYKLQLKEAKEKEKEKAAADHKKILAAVSKSQKTVDEILSFLTEEKESETEGKESE